MLYKHTQVTTYPCPYAMASIHRHLSSLFEAVQVVWCMPVAYRSAKLRQLVLARALYTKYLPLMADDPLVIYGLRHGERPHA